MKISNEQMKKLLAVVAHTSDGEISCQTCEDHMAAFVETQLAGKELSEALREIEAHLKICPECTEELELIRIALQDE